MSAISAHGLTAAGRIVARALSLAGPRLFPIRI